jgi:hypothetical protein
MSSARLGGAWRPIDKVYVREGGLWVDRSLNVWARHEGSWQNIDLSAEPSGLDIYVWILYAGDPYALNFNAKDISDDPTGRNYFALIPNKRTPDYNLAIEFPDASSLVGLKWQKIPESTDGFYTINALDGNTIKNSVGELRSTHNFMSAQHLGVGNRRFTQPTSMVDCW